MTIIYYIMTHLKILKLAKRINLAACKMNKIENGRCTRISNLAPGYFRKQEGKCVSYHSLTWT